MDIQAAKKRCEAATAREAFETWCTINISKIHADALNEAAMGFAAGWEAAQVDLPAALERIADLERQHDTHGCFAREDELAAALEALEEAQMAGRKAQDKWEEWVESELSGTSQFRSAMREVKKNRAILGESK